MQKSQKNRGDSRRPKRLFLSLFWDEISFTSESEEGERERRGERATPSSTFFSCRVKKKIGLQSVKASRERKGERVGSLKNLRVF